MLINLKIEKLRINVTEEQLKNPTIAYDVGMRKKINMIIEVMTCAKCGNLKGLVGPGLCFLCDKEEHPQK